MFPVSYCKLILIILFFERDQLGWLEFIRFSFISHILMCKGLLSIIHGNVLILSRFHLTALYYLFLLAIPLLAQITLRNLIEQPSLPHLSFSRHHFPTKHPLQHPPRGHQYLNKPLLTLISHNLALRIFPIKILPMYFLKQPFVLWILFQDKYRLQNVYSFK